MLERMLIAGAVLIALSGTAAAQGSCNAAGQTALDAGGGLAAVNAWLPCAQAGDTEARYRLASAYVVSGDIAAAIHWLDLAISEARQWSPQPAWLSDAIDFREYLG